MEVKQLLKCHRSQLSPCFDNLFVGWVPYISSTAVCCAARSCCCVSTAAFASSGKQSKAKQWNMSCYLLWILNHLTHFPNIPQNPPPNNPKPHPLPFLPPLPYPPFSCIIFKSLIWMLWEQKVLALKVCKPNHCAVKYSLLHNATQNLMCSQ